MKQESEISLDDRQIDIASHALAEAVVELSSLGGTEDIEGAATSIAKALVAGLQVIQASCNAR